MRNAPRFSAVFLSAFMYTFSMDMEGSIHMIKKWNCMVFAVMLVMQMGTQAFAAEGSIRVNTEATDSALYRVGTGEGDGYRLAEQYGGGYLTFDDTLSQSLADWLFEDLAVEDRIQADKSGKQFSGLEEGLYLVCSDSEAYPPFLVIIPWDGYHWDVEVKPLDTTPPQTSDPIGTMILLMSASGAGITCFCKRKKSY